MSERRERRKRSHSPSEERHRSVLLTITRTLYLPLPGALFSKTVMHFCKRKNRNTFSVTPGTSVNCWGLCGAAVVCDVQLCIFPLTDEMFIGYLYRTILYLVLLKMT